jgi:deoxyribodipyrimidine photo-lyase
LYDPRKQVRDQDPDGEFVRRWVPELDPLPAAHLDAPEKTPLAVQREVGVRIGEDYPYPVADYERARLEFRERYGAVHGAAAARLGDEEIARRASLSGGLGAARSIAADHGGPAEADGDDADATSQTGLDEFG